MLQCTGGPGGRRAIVTGDQGTPVARHIATVGLSGRFESPGYAVVPDRKSKACGGIPVTTMCTEILRARRYKSVSGIPESQRTGESVRGYQIFAPDMDCLQLRGDRR